MSYHRTNMTDVLLSFVAIVQCALIGFVVWTLLLPQEDALRSRFGPDKSVAGYVLDNKYAIEKKGVSDPCFTSDINKIAFVANDPFLPGDGKMGSGVKQVFLLDRQTSSITQATELRNTNDADSTKFCFSTGAFGNSQITVFIDENQLFIDEGNSQPPRFIAHLSEARRTNPVAVSPMGDLVVFNNEQPGFFAPVCSDQMYVANVQSGDIKQVSNFYDYVLEFLIFSPDGEKIAFHAVKCAIGGFGGSHIGIANIDGSVEEFKDFDSSHTVASRSLFFSPDGKFFGFIENKSEESAIIHIYTLRVNHQ